MLIKPEVSGSPIRPSNSNKKADISSGYLLPNPEKSSMLTFLLFINKMVITRNSPVLIIEWLKTCTNEAVNPSGVNNAIARMI